MRLTVRSWWWRRWPAWHQPAPARSGRRRGQRPGACPRATTSSASGTMGADAATGARTDADGRRVPVNAGVPRRRWGGGRLPVLRNSTGSPTARGSLSSIPTERVRCRRDCSPGTPAMAAAGMRSSEPWTMSVFAVAVIADLDGRRPSTGVASTHRPLQRGHSRPPAGRRAAGSRGGDRAGGWGAGPGSVRAGPAVPVLQIHSVDDPGALRRRIRPAVPGHGVAGLASTGAGGT